MRTFQAVVVGGALETPVEEAEIRQLIAWGNDLALVGRKYDALARNLAARVDRQGGVTRVGPHLLEVCRLRIGDDRRKILQVDGAERMNVPE